MIAYGLNRYEAQPVVNLAEGGTALGFELLYRGPRQARTWVESDRALVLRLGRASAGFRPLVNLSSESMAAMDMGMLMRAHEVSGACFEWTEAPARQCHMNMAGAKFRELSSLGVPVLVDDFGSGMDGYERVLAVRQPWAIKISGKLFRAGVNTAEGRLALEHTRRFAEDLGSLFVVEEVESPTDEHFARELRCDGAQGWLWTPAGCGQVFQWEDD